ncbi:NAD(+) diphosphatase [Hellea sp.]|nr:NAD(+) diphosphatase [Hellea sp.]
MTDNFIMPFAGGRIDHVETQRSAAELQAFLAKPQARCICFHKGSPALKETGGLYRIHPSELIGRNLIDPGPIFLGLEGDAPIFAASLQNPEDVTHKDDYKELRSAARFLSVEDMALAGRAKSLLDWHINNRFCANCGQVSQPQEGGLKRKCPSCETEHFPRVNPVVIMLILSGDKVLLGRGAGWPEGAMSALAGFISPGESMEEAVARETFEEVGIKIKNPRYIFSQPWPWPSQLMMGVVCDAESEALTINKAELEDAKWFTRDEVQAVYDKTGDAFLRLPRFTIAHHLLRHWLET